MNCFEVLINSVLKKIILVLLITVTPFIMADKITINDSKTSKSIQISDDAQINRFNYFWSQKQPIKKQLNFEWRYQFIIDDKAGQSRWVYDPKGYTRKISMDGTTVIYQLIPIRSFNRFLIM